MNDAGRGRVREGRYNPASMPGEPEAPETGQTRPGRRSRRAGHTSIPRRVGELLRTSLGVWLAAAGVNVVALVSARSLGPGTALALVAATAIFASLALWAAGRVSVGLEGVTIMHRRVSKRRILAMIFAVILASAATGAVVRLIVMVIDALEAPVDPRRLLGN